MALWLFNPSPPKRKSITWTIVILATEGLIVIYYLSEVVEIQEKVGSTSSGLMELKMYRYTHVHVHVLFKMAIHISCQGFLLTKKSDINTRGEVANCDGLSS